MIIPILACVDPYKAADQFTHAGWNIVFSQLPESGDPLVGVSPCGNSVLLGVTDGYVTTEKILYIGYGVEIHMTVPARQIWQIYEMHQILNPTELTLQPWMIYPSK